MNSRQVGILERKAAIAQHVAAIARLVYVGDMPFEEVSPEVREFFTRACREARLLAPDASPDVTEEAA